MVGDHPGITSPRLHQQVAHLADKYINPGKGSRHEPPVHSHCLSDEAARAKPTSPPQGGDLALLGSPEHGMDPDVIERHSQLSPLPDVHARLVHRKYTRLKPAIGAVFH